MPEYEQDWVALYSQLAVDTRNAARGVKNGADKVAELKVIRFDSRNVFFTVETGAASKSVPPRFVEVNEGVARARL